MKTRAWIAIVMLPALWLALGLGWTRPTEPAAAWAAKPVGHPPPAVALEDGAPDLGEILDRYVDAVGGRDAVAAINTRIVRGRIVTDLPTWDPPVLEVDTLTVYSEAPDRYLAVHRTVEGRTLEGCDGTTAWKRDAEGKVLSVDAVRGGDAWLVDPRFPLRLGEYFPDMAYLGTATLAGRSVHVVEVDDRHEHRLYFDAESGLLARLGYNTTIMRYGEVDGVKVPFEVAYSRKGGSSTFALESVAHNVPIDERLFAAPVSY
jgi:hypothetical protein